MPEFGPVDILINNVGNRIASMPIQEETLETWQQSLDMNLTSCFLGTKIFGAAMLERGQGGRIINIASMSGLIANRGIGGRDYETGKAAVIHFTRCAAADWAPHGITVNSICPGLFMTDTNRGWNERRPGRDRRDRRPYPDRPPRQPAGNRTARRLSRQPVGQPMSPAPPMSSMAAIRSGSGGLSTHQTVVMAATVAAIHVSLNDGDESRGWPGQARP